MTAKRTRQRTAFTHIAGWGFPAVLIPLGLWDIVTRSSWLGFGSDQLSRMRDVHYTLEGWPAVLNGVSFLLLAAGLNLHWWAGRSKAARRSLSPAATGITIVAVVLFFAVHWGLRFVGGGE